ncbi:hypothetical protein MMC25_004702 [Agyrium rufum]|nr:hypothetical protein [Agyrium rufum]
MKINEVYEVASGWATRPSQTQQPLLVVSPSRVAMLWNLTFAVALGWILYRILDIYRKPLEELVEVLGIDLPPIPDVSLAGITFDSVLLYWKPPENYHASLRHFIQVNGINVGEFNRSDASVQVTGLKAGCYYSIRAIVTNSANFSSLGPLIRLRTLQSDGSQQSRPLCYGMGRDTEGAGRISANNLDEIQHPQSSILVRDHDSTPYPTRRTFSGRRAPQLPYATSASTNLNKEASISVGKEHETDGSIPFLNKKLDILRRQQEEVELQVREEEEEAECARYALTKERDNVRQVLKEKEDAQSEFKKQVNDLEKSSKAAQRKKSAKERLLQQKLAERQKMTDDISRWDREMMDMKTDVQSLEIETNELIGMQETKILKLQGTIAECQAMNKSMEDEIRAKGTNIKILEKQIQTAAGKDTDHGEDTEQLEKEKDLVHETRLNDWQNQYATLWQKLQQFAPIPGLNYSSSSGSAQRRFRQGASRANTLSLSPSGYVATSLSSGSMRDSSPLASAITPLFNVNNGTALSTGQQYSISQSDLDVLTAGAPMSPTANMLLPSNLLRDEDAMNARQPHSVESSNSYEVGGLTSLSGHDLGREDPHSPSSSNSRSPSLFSSPRDGPTSRAFRSGSDSQGENDRLSIHSANYPFGSAVTHDVNPMNARRLGALFNFNRQREKAPQPEPPLLGALKHGESQSFPRQMEQVSMNASNSDRRRLTSGTWVNPVSNLLSRNPVSPRPMEKESLSGLRTPGVRRSRLNMFGTRQDTLEPSTLFDHISSRPSSMYSFENGLPRPSTESQPFGWSASNNVQHSSPLGVDWAVTGPWSRSNSRRPSVQHGSSSNLSLGSTPLDPEDFHPGLGKSGSLPAPIGTERFKLSQRPTTPKLNPNAPSFTARFFTRNESKKGSKGEKYADKPSDRKGKEEEKLRETENETYADDSSPSTSRRSRDGRSILTATSMADSHDSLEHFASNTPSEMATTSMPINKESLMQRITRKGSSSKFWAKDRGSLFSKKGGEPSTPGEVDEEVSSEWPVGRSIESASSTPQHEKGNRTSMSWTSIIRKSKKGDKAASESSEKASETETGDDE